MQKKINRSGDFLTFFSFFDLFNRHINAHAHPAQAQPGQQCRRTGGQRTELLLACGADDLIQPVQGGDIVKDAADEIVSDVTELIQKEL